MRSLAIVLGLLVAACSGAPGPSPSPEPDDSFVLRMWTSQAIAPGAAFGQGSLLTIADGVLFTPGAVPAVYPGPLLTPYGAREITGNGIARIVAAAQEAGMLGPDTDFTDGIAPGGITGHIRIGPASAPIELRGDPNAVMMCITTPCVPPPGTDLAFGGFWAWLQSAPFDALAGDLGPEVLAEPERIALLLRAPIEDATLVPQRIAWPLDGDLASAGVPFGGGDERCLTLEGDALATLLPTLQEANQLTRFVDEAGLERGVSAQVLLPGDPDPCAG